MGTLRLFIEIQELLREPAINVIALLYEPDVLTGIGVAFDHVDLN